MIKLSAKTIQNLTAWSLALFGVFLAFPDAHTHNGVYFNLDSGGLVAGAVLIYVGYKVSKGKSDGSDLAIGCMGIVVLLGLFMLAFATIGFGGSESGGYLKIKGSRFQPGEESIAIAIIACLVAWAVGNILLLRAWARQSQEKTSTERASAEKNNSQQHTK